MEILVRFSRISLGSSICIFYFMYAMAVDICLMLTECLGFVVENNENGGNGYTVEVMTVYEATSVVDDDRCVDNSLQQVTVRK
jgi:hypothetical protein